MSLVQQSAFAGEVASADLKGTVHFLASSGRRRTLVVCMQITEGVLTHEATVGGEGDVAFEDTGAHVSTCHCGLDCFFGKLKCLATAVTNSEVCDLEGTVLAGHKLVLEGRLRHIVGDEVGPWS